MRKNTIIFILSTIVGLYALNYLYDFMIKKDTFNKVWWMNHIHDKNYDFAFLGNSRVYTMIRTDSLEKKWHQKGINISLDGSNLAQQYMLLYQFLKNGNTVKDLYLNIDFSNLEGKLDHELRVWCFLPYIYDDTIYSGIKACFGNRAFYWRYIPFYKNIEFNSRIGIFTVGNAIVNLEKKPFNKYGDFTNVSKHKGKIGVSYPANSIKPKAENVRQFEKILVICKEHQIKLHIYTAPMWKEVRDKYLNLPDIKSNYIVRLADKYGAEYHDYTNLSIADSANYFADNTHLNLKGVDAWMKYVEDFKK